MLSGYAVEIFIMISGFVIAGLVIDQKERWPPFIIRRAFRIFPAYLVALAFGALTTPLAVEGLARSPWASDPSSWYFGSMVEGLASTNSHPWAHWILHLTLLQGVVPNNVLPWSAVAFVGPAWSLSLEWQFYLLAPALVWIMRSRTWAAWLVLFACLSAVLFQRGVFGTYETHTSILGGLWLFLIGIASRLALPAIQRANLPLSTIVFGAIGAGLLARELIPVSLWIAFIVLLARPEPRNALDRTIRKLADILLASRVATVLGARSYSVYIIHIPIMKLLLFLMPLQFMTQTEALLWLAPLSISLTLAASELMYRYVERPMIRAGARLAAGRAASLAGASSGKAPTLLNPGETPPLPRFPG